jgi:hypothetical protein
MFAQKIQNITEQIADLTRKANQYRSLEEEASAVIATITRLHQAASALGEEEEIQKAIAQALGIQASPGTPSATPLESEVEPDPEPEEAATIDDLEKYLDPECLQQAISGDAPDLALMEIASLLDTSHQDDLEERVRFFVEKLPSDMGDRLLGYLPKSIAIVWVEVREKVEDEARTSIFPDSQIAVGTRVEIKKDGEQGTVSWVGQNSNGEPVASVTVTSGTRGSIPVEALEIKTEGSPNEPPTSEELEVDELARLCLKQKAWSQMRLFADCNPAVIIRMQELASTKAEKRIINNLPSLILGYIGRANDRTDLEWLPKPVLSEVEALLAQPQAQAIA